MVGAIADNNTFLAALFGGAGVAGPLAARRSQGADSPQEKIQATQGSLPVDTVEISAAGQLLSEADQAEQPRKLSAQTTPLQKRDVSKPSADPQANTSATSSINGDSELTQEDEASVRKLKESDREVRRHEQAHKSAAGGLATGGPTFDFKSGPDGQQYAVGGEVNIDTSPVSGDPQATIRKMQQVRRAALAPASPSGQDRSVASQAAAAEQNARAELAKQRQTSSELQSSPNASEVGKDKNQIEASAKITNETANARGEEESATISNATGSEASAAQISTAVANRASEIVSATVATTQIPKQLSAIQIGSIFNAVA